MTEKLSWNEIRKMYPDEWVILVEVDVNETTDVTAGQVYDHSPDKKYIHSRQLGLKRDAAVLYTGEPKGGIVAALGFAKVDVQR